MFLNLKKKNSKKKWKEKKKKTQPQRNGVKYLDFTNIEHFIPTPKKNKNK